MLIRVLERHLVNIMKTLSVSIFLALGLALAVGCAAPAEGAAAGEETAAQANEGSEENTASQSAALINTSSSGGLGWTADCKRCKDQCDADFPVGDTTNTQCKKRCVAAGTCTKVGGPGVFGTMIY